MGIFSPTKPQPKPATMIARFPSRALPAGVEFAVVPAGPGAVNVSYRLVDEKGEPVEAAVIHDVWLSANDMGMGVALDYAERNHLNTDGRTLKVLEVVSGTVFSAVIENAVLRVQTTASGHANIWFVKATGSVHLAVQLPGWPFPAVSRRITDEDFGTATKMKDIGRHEQEAVAAKNAMNTGTQTRIIRRSTTEAMQ